MAVVVSVSVGGTKVQHYYHAVLTFLRGGAGRQCEFAAMARKFDERGHYCVVGFRRDEHLAFGEASFTGDLRREFRGKGSRSAAKGTALVIMLFGLTGWCTRGLTKYQRK